MNLIGNIRRKTFFGDVDDHGVLPKQIHELERKRKRKRRKRLDKLSTSQFLQDCLFYWTFQL
jgi:hypothetical protein